MFLKWKFYLQVYSNARDDSGCRYAVINLCEHETLRYSTSTFNCCSFLISKHFLPLQDGRFNREVDIQTGYRTKALLCMPIKDASGDVVGVAQVINKQGEQCFTVTDEKVSARFGLMDNLLLIASVQHFRVQFSPTINHKSTADF